MQDLIARLKAHAKLHEDYSDDPEQVQWAADMLEVADLLSRPPLTDAELDGAMLRSVGPTASGVTAHLRGFAREVERAHGITGD